MWVKCRIGDVFMLGMANRGWLFNYVLLHKTWRASRTLYWILHLILQGCLPLVLMFDMKEEIDVEPHFITQLMEQLDVFISIKPKPKQTSKVSRTDSTFSGQGCIELLTTLLWKLSRPILIIAGTTRAQRLKMLNLSVGKLIARVQDSSTMQRDELPFLPPASAHLAVW